jgi:hypothetical protein
MAKGKEGAEKPLDKMTVKELREIAHAIPDLVGIHGMNKQDLLDTVKDHRGIKEKRAKKSGGSIRKIKQQLRELKARKREIAGENDRKKTGILRRQMSRLKKKTRKLA